MAKHEKKDALRIEQLRVRIARWRCARYARCPLPESIWNEATELARRVGPYQAATQLGVSYDSLRKRIDEHPTGLGRDVRSGDAFVEFRGAQLLGAALASGSEVELIGSDGVRLIIRLGNADKLDVPGLLEAFRRFRA